MTRFPWAATPQPPPTARCPRCGLERVPLIEGALAAHQWAAGAPANPEDDGPIVWVGGCDYRGLPAERAVCVDLDECRIIPEAVRDAYRARARVGTAKYGTLLRPHNGRNTRVDLAQELLDATGYAWQAGMESAGIRAIGWHALAVALGWLAWVVGRLA